MKPLLLIAIIISLTASLLRAQNPFTKDSVYIRGSVKGFKPGQKDSFAAFTTYDITGNSKRLAVQIADNGSFSAALYQPFAGDIIFNYKDAFVNLYTAPADTLTLNVDDYLINRSTGNKGAVTAIGKNAGINNIMLQFQSEFDLHTFTAITDLGDKTQSDSTFAARRLLRMTEELAFLDNFIANHHITDKLFKTWQQNDMIYNAAKDAMYYPFLRLNKEITPKQLATLIKNIPVENPAALQNSAYYNFLRMLASDQQIMVNINPLFDEAKKQNGNNPMSLYLDDIDKIAQGISRELMYYDTYNPASKYNTDELKERFKSVIKQPYISRQFDRLLSTPLKFTAYNLSARIKSLNISDSLKTKLATLFDKQRGTNLYLDFWGDWCQPCMSEMPGYPTTIAALKGKPLKFIFLSAHTTTQSMLAVKAKFGIDAEFVNLTNNEVAVLNNALEFHSYPSHFIINAGGDVISNSARSVEQINKVLAN